MTDRKLSISELLEGGLAVMFARPFVVALIVLADAVFEYGLSWAQLRYGRGFAAIIGVGLVGYALLTSSLILALDGRITRALADPVEVFVRVVFVLAASLVVTVAAGLGALLFIVPGLYVLARCTVVSPLILLEGAGIGAALRRSWELTETSAWALVAVGVIIYLPPLLLAFFGAGDELQTLTPRYAFELILGSGLRVFEVAMMVFAYRELAPQRDELSEVFA